MTVQCVRFHLTMWIVILISATAPIIEAAEQAPKSIRIDKFYFMFHPVCFRQYGPDAIGSYDQKNWTAWYERELRANEQQKELISRMKPNEVMVIFPIGSSEAMQDLEQHATKTLGRRAIIFKESGPTGYKSPPAAWRNTPNLIEHFLNDPKLAGRDDFLRDVPAHIQTELEAEIRGAWETHKSGWNPGVLKVVYFSRLTAMDIVKELEQRNLTFDAATVQSVAIGDGFEQCAMTWKQMLVPYLGFAHPAENDFDLSVSSAGFVVNTQLKERIKLTHDLRLFLWEGEGGKKIALYARVWCRLKDPQLYADVPLKGMSLAVRNVQGKEYWPNPAGPEMALNEENGHLKVPIYNGIRRDFPAWRNITGVDEEVCYLIADDISMQDFRDRLANAHRGE